MYVSHYLGHEVYNLHGTDEREASEEPHGSSYGWQFIYKLGCSVLQRMFVLFIKLMEPQPDPTLVILSNVELSK